MAVVAVVALAGCGITRIGDLNFRVDDRLDFAGPEVRSTVRAPVTVAWTMDDFRIASDGSEPPSDDAGYFAVFVDQSPIKPGHTLADVADGDDLCEGRPGCPDKAYLVDHAVYTTTATSIELPVIADIAGSEEELQLHTITVVLMDTSGHRIGESAWQLDVRMRKVGG